MQATQRGARRAAEVVNGGAFGDEFRGELRQHALDFGVLGHAARDHVVEHARNGLVEDEIVDVIERIGEDLVRLWCRRR
jgi:hypothetical protein